MFCEQIQLPAKFFLMNISSYLRNSKMIVIWVIFYDSIMDKVSKEDKVLIEKWVLPNIKNNYFLL